MKVYHRAWIQIKGLQVLIQVSLSRDIKEETSIIKWIHQNTTLFANLVTPNPDIFFEFEYSFAFLNQSNDQLEAPKTSIKPSFFSSFKESINSATGISRLSLCKQ